MENEQKTFRELFCAERGIAPKKFERVILRRTLHRTALAFYPLWKIVLPGCFSKDLKFISDLGDCRNAREARDVFEGFSSGYRQESFTRRILKIRVSKKDALWIANHTLPSSTPPVVASPGNRIT